MAIVTDFKHISIHVPREGHDDYSAAYQAIFNLFQSTCPARGTTVVKQCLRDGDGRYFNPRAPRGARPQNISDQIEQAHISIHVPREGHDDTYHDNYLRFGISIHVPREGHDSSVKL